jgi:hypothetical protein
MKVARSFVSIACVGIGLVAIEGCQRTERERATGTTTEEGRPGTATVTGAHVTVVNNAAAVDRIVGARCAREMTCKNIGHDRKFADQAACTTKVKTDMKDDLNAKDCPYGVDQKELDECLDAIKKEDCNNPIDVIGRLAACRTSDLCLKTAPSNR